MFVTLLERSVTVALANTGTLMRVGWAYMLLLVAVNIATGHFLNPGSGFSTVSYMTEPVSAPDEGAFRILALTVNMLIGFSIAIAYIRRILIEARDFPLVLSKRTFAVVVNMILLGLIGLAAFIPLLIVSGILTLFTGPLGALLLFAAPFVSLMLVQKFSVVLPATALDDPMTLRESWRATRGLGWPMAFSALIMTLLAGCLVGIWYVILWGAGALTSNVSLLEQIRSALFPMGAMLLIVWVFASLHATFYGLIRERFAARLGLTGAPLEQANTARTQARAKAQRAVSAVRAIKRD